MFSTCIKVNEWMSGFGGPWGIAGGWAIDLFIGKETRPHSDVEVAIFREDQHILKKVLQDWSFEKAVNSEFISWDEEWLELPVHEIHGVHKKSGERLEVLLNEIKDSKWILEGNRRFHSRKIHYFSIRMKESHTFIQRLSCYTKRKIHARKIMLILLP